VAGLLVLLITVLVVNQLLSRRQSRQRGHAVAAQAAIMAAQAARSVKAISSLLHGSGDRDAASGADGQPGRALPQQSQYLGGVTGRALAAVDRCADGAAVPGAGIDDAMRQMQGAAAPLLMQLSPVVRDSVQRIGQTAEE
jgi:hypothetical protein